MPADRPQRAEHTEREIEAVALLLTHAYGQQDFDESWHRKIAGQILDRARDARSDEPPPIEEDPFSAERSDEVARKFYDPQGEGHEAADLLDWRIPHPHGLPPSTLGRSSPARNEDSKMPPGVWLCPQPAHRDEFYVPHGGICPALGCAERLIGYFRSPQGEDHEAGIERIVGKMYADAIRAAREVDALFDGEGPGRWTYAGKRITDDAAEPLLSMHDYLNTLAYHAPSPPPARDARSDTVAVEDVERMLAETSKYFAGDHVNAGVVVGHLRRRLAEFGGRAATDDQPLEGER